MRFLLGLSLNTMDDRTHDSFNSLEPDVIITDGHVFDDKLSMDKDDLEENNPLLIGPEISIIPVPSKPPAKIRVRNFLEEEHRLIRHRERSPRGNVRIVSPAEIVKAEIKYSYSRRKSLPLEKCPICKKFFRRMKTHLLKHEEQQRGPDDPLTCKLCKKDHMRGAVTLTTSENLIGRILNLNDI
ncbi:hypothetical protein QE152_g30348 [Popillia japonica]|uniref:C2H2-type domain-containing protein n=1 Tax=Popillia japonica TaxID=7064 RepID=A0AAW1JEX6_POPJA